MPLVPPGGLVQDRAVVPHDQHAGLPLVGVGEARIALPLLQVEQQRDCFILRQAFDPDDIAQR